MKFTENISDCRSFSVLKTLTRGYRPYSHSVQNMIESFHIIISIHIISTISIASDQSQRQDSIPTQALIFQVLFTRILKDQGSRVVIYGSDGLHKCAHEYSFCQLYSVSFCEILKRKPGRIKGHKFHSHLSQADRVRR